MLGVAGVAGRHGGERHCDWAEATTLWDDGRTAGSGSGRRPGTLTQTSTGTCLQIVLGTQIVLVSVTCRVTVTGQQIVLVSATCGRRCTGTLRTHWTVCISQTVSGTHLDARLGDRLADRLADLLDAGLGDHPAGRHRAPGMTQVSADHPAGRHGHLLDALLGDHPAGGDRDPLDAGLADHPGDGAGHLLVRASRLTIRVTVYGTCLTHVSGTFW